MSKDWKSQQRLTNKKGGSTLSKKDKFYSGSLFTINIICDCSKELHSEYFSNKISSIDLKSLMNNHIKKILELDGRRITIDNIPFNSRRGHLEINHYNKKRMESIFGLYNINPNEEEIMKCDYDNEIGVLSSLPKNLLRVFLKMRHDNKTIDVLLIDPYHLVATANYVKLFNESKHKYRYCYSELKKLPKFG